VPNVQWKTPVDGQMNYPKHVEFLDKNKFGKLVRLLVLLKINLLHCTVTGKLKKGGSKDLTGFNVFGVI
jgi:hypothetical protein